MTRKHALRSTLYRPALDAEGRLLIGAAVGINGDVAGRAEALLAAGVDVLVVDTAHGHQEQDARPALREVRGARPGPGAAGRRQRGLRRRVSDLVEAGADVVKVGVGRGRCAPPG